MSRFQLFLLLTACLFAGACGGRGGDALMAMAGEPLPGLDSAMLARFAAGRSLFGHEFTPPEGLGPLFNQRRCSSCHDLPALGGTGVEIVRKATGTTPDGRCDLLEGEGGDNVQQRATALLMAAGVQQEARPAHASAAGDITAPPLFGAGLVEAVPEEAILARVDSADRDGDGISGRAGRTKGGRVGRFGRKADFANIEDFIDGALRFELGLTTPEHPLEQTINGRPLPDGVDVAPDPEIDDDQLNALTDFVRLLALPAAAKTDVQAVRDTIARGERVFGDIGCAECHVPRLRTGPSDIPALDHRAFPFYSDLLLHDMGPSLAGICGVAASGSEWRTPSLVGLRLRLSLLHDGRAEQVERAIRLHGGEAQAAARRYGALTAAERAALNRFLNSL